MCGIVGYVGPRACAELLVEGLRRLEYRGYDSAGVAVWDGERVGRVRAEGKLAMLERRLADEPLPGSVGVAHTRWATHGAPTERNAHPHRVRRVTLVHNGIIENYAPLRTELEAAGEVFASDTDTEIVAHLVARELDAGHALPDAVIAALDRIRGSWALVVHDEQDPERLVAARSASPLVIGVSERETFAASDVPAILAQTRDMIFLEDGDVATLTAGGVEILDGGRTPVERPVRRIHWDPVSAEKQGFKHFMLKEIHEQPARLVDTLRGRLHPDDLRVELSEVALEPAWLRDIDRVVILACGTSYHAGMVARYAIESIARLPVEVEVASEFRYREPVVSHRTLLIAVSQSGETADTLAAARTALDLGARSVAICNVMESSLARLCQNVVYTHAGPEIGVASTKAFTTQLAALYVLALWLGEARGTLDTARRQHLVQALRELPGAVERAVETEPEFREIAKDLTDAPGFLFMGRGNLFPIALEGALKLKEISYIHAEGYAAGEMKHGPIALIDEHLPVVALAPRTDLFEKVASNIEEVRARGGRVIVIGTEGDAAVDSLADVTIRIPDVDAMFLPLVAVVPLQLLAYCIADAKGTDVDQPRNLAKSVTVE